MRSSDFVRVRIPVRKIPRKFRSGEFAKRFFRVSLGSRLSQCGWTCSREIILRAKRYTCVSRLQGACRLQRPKITGCDNYRWCAADLVTSNCALPVASRLISMTFLFAEISHLVHVIPIGPRGGYPTRNPVAACQIRPRINPITASDGMPIASQGLQPNRCCVYICPPPPLSFSLSLSVSHSRGSLSVMCVNTCSEAAELSPFAR